MKTVLLKQQHEKLIKIIEMIDKNEYYLSSTKKQLQGYLHSRHKLAYPRFYQENKENQIELRGRMASRLETYYRNQLDKIITHAPNPV